MQQERKEAVPWAGTCFTGSEEAQPVPGRTLTPLLMASTQEPTEAGSAGRQRGRASPGFLLLPLSSPWLTLSMASQHRAPAGPGSRGSHAELPARQELQQPQLPASE